MKKIISIGVILVMCMSAGLFSGCEKNRTEEEHLQEINKIVQAFYIEHKGDGASIKPVNFTGFETQLLYAFDGTPEYFLVEFAPAGYTIGIISKNRYYFGGRGLGGDLNGVFHPSPYEVNSIDKTNRYFAAIDTGILTGWGTPWYNDHYAMIENGILVDILTGETYPEQEFKKIAENSRKHILSLASTTELNYGQ